MSDQSETCDTCRFAYGAAPAEKRVCRRYPPTGAVYLKSSVFGEMTYATIGAWPSVVPTDWCGEYAGEPRP